MSRLLFSVTAVFFLVESACADIILFQIDEGNGTINGGDTLTVNQNGLVVDGVMFDLALTVVGSGTLNQGTTGLGVEVDSSDLVSNGEFLSFSLVMSNNIGGTVTFDGFTEVDFNSFGATDVGVLSIDNDIGTVGDNFFVTMAGAGDVDISGTSPTSFSAIARSDGPGSNSFRIDNLSGAFSGTAVPEPGGLCLSCLVFTMSVLRRTRVRGIGCFNSSRCP